jgi:hypothetical protein
MRLTSAALQVAQHESNIFKVFTTSVAQNPFVLIGFIGLMILWIFLYKKVKFRKTSLKNWFRILCGL